MKKILFFSSVLAGLFLAGSCQREQLEPSQVSGNVTFTVEVPAGIETKSISDGTNVDQLIYEVWMTDDQGKADLANATKLYQAETELVLENNVRKATLELELMNDQNFTVLFWAQVRGTGAYDTDELTEVTYAKELDKYLANDESLAAFYAAAYVADGQHVDANARLSTPVVTLYRPFAQLNLGTRIVQTPYTVALDQSDMTVSDIPTKFNVATKEVADPVSMTFSMNDVPNDPSTIEINNEEFKWAGMNYIFAGDNVTVEYNIATNVTATNDVETTATINNVIQNVPIKENYRTNIIGNLLSSKVDYEIVVDANWADNGASMEVVGEGIVQNINGDYEISNARGLAYAMNNLFKNGGNFYLTAAEYDMTGLQVTVPTIQAGKTLNIYGETPVVTRSTTTLAGVTIKGLKSLIGTVESGAAITISGVDMPTDNAVLIEKNEGTVAVSDCTVGATQPSSQLDDLIGEDNGAVVNADEVDDIAKLNAALASGAKVINITADITATEFISITRSVTINGNGRTLATSANRAIRLTQSEIAVTINNLDIVSSAVMVYPSDVRGVSIDASLSNVSLTLNDCTIDFTDKTTNDWTYAVNVSGSGTGHNVAVNGGSYEGANVINVHGAKNTITVKGATLNSLYPDHEIYYGACIWVLQNQGSSVYAEGNTFNGNNAIAFNLGNGTTLVENGNTDNTMFYKEGSYYVASAEKLQYAANNVSKSSKIVFAADLAGNVTILQRDGINLEINGNGHKFDGVITVNGGGRAAGTETLTFKDIKFETAGSDFTFISAPSKINDQYNYSHNVTIEDCTFTGNHTTGSASFTGTYNFVMKNCTAENMHSILQAQSCDNKVLVENVTVNNGKNGLSFGNTAYPTIKNSTINASEYGVRADGNASRGSLVIENSVINAAKPVIVRKMTTDSYAVAIDEASKLNPTDLYHVVFTNGDDAADYVTPTGNFSITGADDLIVYPRENYGNKVADGLYKNAKTYYIMDATGLVNMSSRTIAGNENVELAADIDLAGIEFNGLNAFNPETPNVFDGKGHTVSNWTYEGGASDMGFIKGWVGTIKNLTIENASLKTGGRSGVIAGKVYANIENCHVVSSAIEDSFWACGLIAGHYNSGSVSDCSATNSTVKSNGATGGIVGLLNETTGTRSFTNCTVTGCTVNNTGAYGEEYSGALVCGLINISNSTIKFVGCEYSNNNTKEGQYVGDLYYADGGNTIVVE